MISEKGVRVVQFHHCGGEHLVNMDSSAAFHGQKDRRLILEKGIMPWNDGQHRRKFITCNGKYINKNNELCEDKIMFWGEYESISKVKKIMYKQGVFHTGLPQYIHIPLYCDFDENEKNPIIEPKGKQGEHWQNTDPFVFGNYFIYSNCQQQRNKKLRNLAPGSIIIMGSKKGEFRIDTLLVISEALCKVSRSNMSEINELMNQGKISKVFYNNTINALFNCGSSNNIANDCEFTIYKCANYYEPINGMYSFFPCKKFKENEGFERITVKYNKIINPKLGINVKITDTDLNYNYDIWGSIKNQVLNNEQGLSLGIYAEEPKII